MKIDFFFDLKPHPYANEYSSNFDVWGQIQLIHNDNNIIFIYEWNILELVNWFFEKKDILLSEPILRNTRVPIAELMDDLYNDVTFETPLTDVELLEDYFSNHIFKLRGTRLPTYYFGLNAETKGELSFKSANNEYHVFVFDMKEFISTTTEKIIKLINEWHNSEFKNYEALVKIKEIEQEYKITLLNKKINL